MSKIIFALIIVATQGGEPEYEKVYSTESGCQRAVTRVTTEQGNSAAWCVALTIDLAQPEAN